MDKFDGLLTYDLPMEVSPKRLLMTPSIGIFCGSPSSSSWAWPGAAGHGPRLRFWCVKSADFEISQGSTIEVCTMAKTLREIENGKSWLIMVDHVFPDDPCISRFDQW